jgi:hypothetical protein
MRQARVSGPIVGALPPAGSPRRDLTAVGYLCEEYLLEGTTVAYEHLDEGRPDPRGHWLVGESGEADYRTRILVVRPSDPEQFNGTVLLHWQNVSAGHEIERPEGDELYRGYAWVGVSAQELSLYGAPWGAEVRGRKSPAVGLVDTDPERYSTLFHPGDAGSFEIFGQAAHAVGPNRDLTGPTPDPLGGLSVRRVIATGGSQSAMRLVSYVNGIHLFHRAIHGFLLSVWEGRVPRLDDGPVPVGMRAELRDDLDVPVLTVNSEFEAAAGATLALADSDRLRIWEVTGTSHGRWRKPVVPISERGWGPNPLGWAPVHEAAVRAIHGWVSSGIPARAQPRIATEQDGSGKILRDERGIALGGVRLPEIAVPLAEYRGTSFRTGFGALYGGYRPFKPDVVKALYGDRESFVQAWDRAVADLVQSETLLPEDAEAIRARGRDASESLPID